VRLAKVADKYLERFGDHEVAVARAPGRVNLMGRHVDHQGGHCNMMALEPDVFVMAGTSSDNTLSLINLDPVRFPDSEIPLSAALEGYGGGDWSAYVDSGVARNRARQAGGRWHIYVEAALARVMAEYPDIPIHGLRAVVHGSVPIAAGLSSSSALVVASTEAILALCGLSMTPADFVRLCAEGEWYVGTRGGAGDQAAMKFARRGAVVQLGFHPLTVEASAPWPADHTLMVANSRLEARKSGSARDIFNQRVACYHIGREILRHRRANLRERVQHLRDLTPARLGAPDHQVAAMLLDLPEALSRSEVADAVGKENAERLLSSHDCGDAPYPIRGVVAFGLAECERSRLCAELLADGDIESIGKYMRVSHDGDRVSSLDGTWQWHAGKPYGDDEVGRLVSLCRDGHRLADEPGAYACSTPEIDAMVDILLEVPGVLGAQMSGAGLGGSMMALMRTDAVGRAKQALVRSYYEPRGLEPAILSCAPASGCGLINPPRA